MSNEQESLVNVGIGFANLLELQKLNKNISPEALEKAVEIELGKSAPAFLSALLQNNLIGGASSYLGIKQGLKQALKIVNFAGEKIFRLGHYQKGFNLGELILTKNGLNRLEMRTYSLFSICKSINYTYQSYKKKGTVASITLVGRYKILFFGSKQLAIYQELPINKLVFEKMTNLLNAVKITKKTYNNMIKQLMQCKSVEQLQNFSSQEIPNFRNF